MTSTVFKLEVEEIVSYYSSIEKAIKDMVCEFENCTGETYDETALAKQWTAVRNMIDIFDKPIPINCDGRLYPYVENLNPSGWTLHAIEVE